MTDQARRVCERCHVGWDGPAPCWSCSDPGDERPAGFKTASVAGKGSVSGTNYEPDLAERIRMRGEIVTPADQVEGAA